jgi:GWxTD domain-containing protein
MKHFLLRGAFLLAAIQLMSAVSPAGPKVIGGKGALHVDMDIARFYGDDTSIYVQIYYGIREYMLTYVSDGGSYSGTVSMQLAAKKNGAIVYHDSWNVPHPLSDTAHMTTAQSLVGVNSFFLTVGDYTISFAATDKNDPARTDTFSFPLKITLFPAGREAISDLELCTTIRQGQDKNSIFYKNTLEVVPNPGLLYGEGMSTISYYAEAYNLLSKVHGDSITVRTSVKNGAGIEGIHQIKKKARLVASSVEVGKIDVSSLKGGSYVFTLSFQDSAGNDYASTRKKFFIYRPGTVDSSMGAQMPAYASSEYAVKTADELEKELAHIHYITNDAEQKQIKALTTTDAKRQFLYQFWLTRTQQDPTVKDEYFKRVDYANEHYSKSFREGWKSDMGRVYIVYGAYDDLEDFPNSAENNPYQNWHYNNIQGGVIFVFVDKTGLGSFTLVHSTDRNEIQDPNYMADYVNRSQ